MATSTEPWVGHWLSAIRAATPKPSYYSKGASRDWQQQPPEMAQEEHLQAQKHSRLLLTPQRWSQSQGSLQSWRCSPGPSAGRPPGPSDPSSLGSVHPLCCESDNRRRDRDVITGFSGLGMGFRAQGKLLGLALGYSHPELEGHLLLCLPLLTKYLLCAKHCSQNWELRQVVRNKLIYVQRRTGSQCTSRGQ